LWTRLRVVYGAFLGILWCVQRLFVKTPAGRQRLNVLAALNSAGAPRFNAITREVHFVANQTYVSAETVCQLLQQLAALHGGVAITVILDNARYQRCALVHLKAQRFPMEMAAALHIELLFLPAYSPNLNLIERFWKFVKKRCLYGQYYPDSAAFQQAILDCITNAPTEHQAQLETLLSLKFQTFQDVPILGEQAQGDTLKERQKDANTLQKVLSMAA
jgi:transposase